MISVAEYAPQIPDVLKSFWLGVVTGVDGLCPYFHLDKIAILGSNIDDFNLFFYQTFGNIVLCTFSKVSIEIIL